MSATIAKWLDDEILSSWTSGQTNAALRTKDAATRAQSYLSHANLPTHEDAPKNWDTFLAVYHAVANAQPCDAILDAGAERYSAFLPALRCLGYTNLIGVNLTFSAADESDGIKFQHADITRTDFPSKSFAFIACLSVIEHGVDVEAFLDEAARLLHDGGCLFLSFDFWETPVDTRGQSAYGVPIRIFTSQDVNDMLRVAAKRGLFVGGARALDCQDRVVWWRRFDLRYTFANLLLTKGG